MSAYKGDCKIVIKMLTFLPNYLYRYIGGLFYAIGFSCICSWPRRDFSKALTSAVNRVNIFAWFKAQKQHFFMNNFRLVAKCAQLQQQQKMNTK